ncbi:uncharacterized protein LOC120528082 isoform X2 [Polypterus senegalus]|uniref:uncharacterized protein LOC120528082 isoform X2 n=1 Tax=Polypterus senegalus TaxID=55291 RepID=UPI001962C2AC|nr:uncharacterized protein LOC120528082 isoform X2 [Polypterus senegalus]
MESLRSHTTDVLMELKEDELKRFWKKLDSVEPKHHCKHIPLGKLEQADNSVDTAGELAHLMTGYYGEKAIDVLLDTLDEIGRKDLKNKVKDFMLCEGGCKEHSKRRKIDYNSQYRDEIKHKLEKIREYNSLPGERVDFNARYTKLTLIKKHQQRDDKEKELKEKGKKHTILMEKHRNMSIDVENLFSPVDEKEEERKKEPKTVVIQGPAGIGKSFTIHKIMLDWACGKLFHERFQYVFQLRCRELKINKNDSLDDLILTCSDSLKPVLQEILCEPENLLFIFDGFDELKLPSGKADDRNQEEMASSTVIKLLNRNIMSRASLLITTRPTALQAIDEMVKIDRYSEIVGFLEDEIREYFIKSFQDQDKALSAFNIIKGNNVVLSMCFVPLVCWIVCSIMKKGTECGDDLMKNMKTDSQVLLHFINKLLEHHCSTSEKTAFIEKVSRLAFAGIKEEKLVFTDKDLSRFSINSSGSESTFFSKLFYKTDIDAKTVYHFLHLSVQELFAAMYFASHSSSGEIAELLNDCLDTNNGNLIHVVRFVFGLTNVKSKEIFEEFQMWSSAELKTCLQSWIPKAVECYRVKSPFLLQLLYCLYEMQEPQLAAHAMTILSQITLRGCPLSSIDCAVIKYCIEQSSVVKEIDVYNCHLTEDEVKMLWGILPKCQSVRLNADKITESTLKLICGTLNSQTYQWIQLSVKKSENVFNLSFEAGSHENDSSISLSCICESLVEQFLKNTIPKYKPTSISISGELGERTITYLRKMLKNENLMLESLRIEATFLNDQLNAVICGLISLDSKATFVSWRLCHAGENRIILQHEAGSYFTGRNYWLNGFEEDYEENEKLERYEEKLLQEEKCLHRLSVSHIDESTLMCICELIIPKCKPIDIDVSGPIGEGTLRLILEMLIAEDYKPMDLRLHAQGEKDAEVNIDYTIMFEIIKMESGSWDLVCDDEINYKPEDSPYYSEFRIYSRIFNDPSLIHSIQILIQKYKPCNIDLKGELGEKTAGCISEILKNKEYIPKQVSISSENMTEATALKLCSILSEEHKMKKISWVVTQGIFFYLMFNKLTVEYKIDQFYTRFSVFHVSECNMINVCKMIIPKFNPTYISLDGDFGEKAVKSITNVLQHSNYTPRSVSLWMSGKNEASPETIFSVLPVDNTISWDLSLSAENCSAVKIETDRNESRLLIRNVSESKTLTICRIIIPKCNPAVISLSGDLNKEAVNSITEIIKDANYTPKELSICSEHLNDTAVEHICSTLFAGKQTNVTLDLFQSGENSITYGATFESSDEIDGLQIRFSFNHSNVICNYQEIISKYKPKDISLSGNFDKVTVETIIKIPEDKGYSPDCLRLKRGVLSESIAVGICDILTSHITLKNVNFELSVVDDEENITLKYEAGTSKSGITSGRMSNLSTENICSLLLAENKLKSMNWKISNHDYNYFSDLSNITFDYEAEGSKLRFSICNSNESEVMELCKQILPKYKPTEIDLSDSVGEKTFNVIYEILKAADYAPSHLRMGSCILKDISMLNICTLLASDCQMKNMSWKLEEIDGYEEWGIYERKSWISLKHGAGSSEASFSLSGVNECSTIEILKIVISSYKPVRIKVYQPLGEEAIKTIIGLLSNEEYTPKFLRIASKHLTSASAESINTILSSYNKMKIVRKPEPEC